MVKKILELYAQQLAENKALERAAALEKAAPGDTALREEFEQLDKIWVEVALKAERNC